MLSEIHLLRLAILAETDYTIPTVGLSLALYALIDKVIVPLIKKDRDDVANPSRTGQQVTNDDIKRRLGEVERDGREIRDSLSKLTTELTVAVAILKRIKCE